MAIACLKLHSLSYDQELAFPTSNIAAVNELDPEDLGLNPIPPWVRVCVFKAKSDYYPWYCTKARYLKAVAYYAFSKYTVTSKAAGK